HQTQNNFIHAITVPSISTLIWDQSRRGQGVARGFRSVWGFTVCWLKLWLRFPFRLLKYVRSSTNSS
ncbi:hypothetical protein HAX54_035351, partial [Datura stramonium]|nr:hypothetical protein [Datura stramonium]